MNKKMFIFAFSFFSMTLLCMEQSEESSVEKMRKPTRKRKLSGGWSGSQEKRQARGKQYSFIAQNRDDDVEMLDADVADAQEPSGKKILKYALQLKKKGITGSFPVDVCIDEIKEANSYIFKSKGEMKELLNQSDQFNWSLFFTDESDRGDGESTIGLSKLLQGSEQKKVGDELKKIGQNISFWQYRLDTNKEVLELYDLDI